MIVKKRITYEQFVKYLYFINLLRLFFYSLFKIIGFIWGILLFVGINIIKMSMWNAHKK